MKPLALLAALILAAPALAGPEPAEETRRHQGAFIREHIAEACTEAAEARCKLEPPLPLAPDQCELATLWAAGEDFVGYDEQTRCFYVD